MVEPISKNFVMHLKSRPRLRWRFGCGSCYSIVVATRLCDVLKRSHFCCKGVQRIVHLEGLFLAFLWTFSINSQVLKVLARAIAAAISMMVLKPETNESLIACLIASWPSEALPGGRATAPSTSIPA